MQNLVEAIAMKQRNVMEIRQKYLLSVIIALLVAVTGCSTSTTYREPITQFQSAVNQTIATVQPYFIEVNRVEAEYQLYSALKNKEDWGTQHLDRALDGQQIALRLQALQLIVDHTRVLSDIVNATAPQEMKEAAEALGASAQGLARAVDSLAKKDDVSNSKGAEDSAVRNFSTPLTEIVNLVGEKAIEYKQTKAIEEAVLKAEKPLGDLIELLESDLQTIVNERRQAFQGIATVRLELFNEIRKTTKPEKIDSLIQEVLDLNSRVDTIESINVTSLLQGLKSTHKALVEFVKSDRTPANLTQFVASVDAFADNVEAVSSVIQSLREFDRGGLPCPQF
jgi:hypothetical protein